MTRVFLRPRLRVQIPHIENFPQIPHCLNLANDSISLNRTPVICGVCVSLSAIIVDLQSKVEKVGVGYFLLAGSMILASALWRSEGLGEDRFRSIQRVYSVLASGPIDMESLIKRLTGEN